MISRRAFMKWTGLGALALGLGPALSRWRNTVEVVVLRPLADQKYSNAAKKHFAHKMYPSEEAARERLPYRGLKFRTVTRRLPVPAGVTKETLFSGRYDLDIRVKSDLRHMHKIGIPNREVERLLLS